MKSEKKRKKLYQQQSNVNIINIGTHGGGGGKKKRRTEVGGFDEAASEALGMLQRLPYLTPQQAVSTTTTQTQEDQPSPTAVQIPDATPWYDKAIEKGLDIGTQVLTAGLEIGVGTKIASALGGGAAAQGAGQVLGSKARQTAEEKFDEYVSSFWRPKAKTRTVEKAPAFEEKISESQFPLLSDTVRTPQGGNLSSFLNFSKGNLLPGTGGFGRSRSLSLNDLSPIYSKELTPQQKTPQQKTPSRTPKREAEVTFLRPEQRSYIDTSAYEQAHGGKLEGFQKDTTFRSPYYESKDPKGLTWKQIKQLPKIAERVHQRKLLNITAPKGDKRVANLMHLYDTGAISMEEMYDRAEKLGARIGREGEDMPLAVGRRRRDRPLKVDDEL